MSLWAIEEAARQAQIWEQRFGFNAPSLLTCLVACSNNLIWLTRFRAFSVTWWRPAPLSWKSRNRLMKDLQGVVPSLHRLNQLGTEISIDDFGTGYSSGLSDHVADQRGQDRPVFRPRHRRHASKLGRGVSHHCPGPRIRLAGHLPKVWKTSRKWKFYSTLAAIFVRDSCLPAPCRRHKWNNGCPTPVLAWPALHRQP